jgi:TetR/AcrR family transcriptional regulator, regulator of autoinduction and epiphytic fitness
MTRGSQKTIRAADSDHNDSGHAVDGRSARRDRNRLAVIDAAIQLFSEGNLRPDPADIALRCGLSPKSVSRYFEDLDSLIGAAAARQMEQVFPIYQIHAIGQGSLDHRIDDFVRTRLQAYEVMGATDRAAALLALRQPSVQNALDDARVLARKQIEAQFATELESLSSPQRDSRVAAIDALFQSETLDYFSIHRKFSVGVTHSMLVDALSRLLESQRQRTRSGVPSRSRHVRTSKET